MSISVSNLNQMQGVNGSSEPHVYLTESGREGNWIWNSSNLSAEVSSDPLRGLFNPPSTDTSGASGAWVREFDGVINAGWFGFSVTANGGDNRAALQAAIDYARQPTEILLGNPERYIITRSDVHINPGEYNISGRVSLYNGIRVIGSGQSNTLIKHAGGGTQLFDWVSVSGELLYNTWVMDLAILGGGKTTSGTVAAFRSSDPSGARSVYGCGVTRCYVANCYEAFNLQNSWTFEISDCEVFDVGRNFIRGLNLTAARIKGNRFDASDEDGIFLTFAANGLKTIDCVLSQNVVQSCQRRAVYGFNAAHVVSDHNYYENCNQAGGYAHVEFANTTGTNSEMYSFMGDWFSPSSNTGQPAVRVGMARFVSAQGVYVSGNAFSHGFELGSEVDTYDISGEFNGGAMVSADAGVNTGISCSRNRLDLLAVNSELHRASATGSNAVASLNTRIQEIDCTGGTRRYTIPDNLLQIGRRFTVQKTDGSSNALIVVAEGASVKVNGQTGPVVNTRLPYARAEVICGREPGTSTLSWYVTFTGA